VPSRHLGFSFERIRVLQKAITFKDLDGNDVTEIFYFNVNKAEIAEMEVSKRGGMSQWIKNVSATENAQEVMSTFKQIILMAVGRRSEDGRRFIKNQEIRDDFEQTEAYSQLFMELVTNAQAGAEFIKGIMPKDLAEAIDADANLADELQLPAGESSPVQGEELPIWVRERREPNQNELVGLSQAELLKAFAWREQLQREKREPSQ